MRARVSLEDESSNFDLLKDLIKVIDFVNFMKNHIGNAFVWLLGLIHIGC